MSFTSTYKIIGIKNVQHSLSAINIYIETLPANIYKGLNQRSDC